MVIHPSSSCQPWETNVHTTVSLIWSTMDNVEYNCSVRILNLHYKVIWLSSNYKSEQNTSEKSSCQCAKLKSPNYTDLQQHPLVSQQGRSCPTVCYAIVEVWLVCHHAQLVSSLAWDVIMLKQMSSGSTPAKLSESGLKNVPSLVRTPCPAWSSRVQNTNSSTWYILETIKQHLQTLVLLMLN